MSAGLYIHVPFCKTKCPYCDFYSITDISLVPLWLDAVSREMALYQERFREFDSLYIGGGTPSFLDEKTIETLITSVHASWTLSPGAEITLEANPDDVRRRKISLYRSLGINRLSLGVQSLDDGELSFLRRRHTADRARQALESVRAEFDNFGIDLIYGLDGQTERRWLKTLGEALSFHPSHVSCYQLTVESHTPFGRLKAEGSLKPLTEASEERLFLVTSRYLEERGFVHYEISNFAKDPESVSRHNMKYWNHSPYLGLGPGAHSFSNGRRWWNHRSLDRYLDSLSRGEEPVEGSEALSPEQIRLERLSLGLRTKEGVSLADLPDSTAVLPALLHIEKHGLVTVQDGRITPTRKGFLLADRLPLMFPD